MGSSIAVVHDVDDEDEHMGLCSCGGQWRLASEMVIPLSQRWFDSLVMTCTRCSQSSGYIFDITPFFDPRPGVWAAAAA
jgi:hypothetical protein